MGYFLFRILRCCRNAFYLFCKLGVRARTGNHRLRLLAFLITVHGKNRRRHKAQKCNKSKKQLKIKHINLLFDKYCQNDKQKINLYQYVGCQKMLCRNACALVNHSFLWQAITGAAAALWILYKNMALL